MARPHLYADISLNALTANVDRMRERMPPDPVADLRQNASGHGIATVASILRDAGVRRAVVDDATRETAQRFGLTPTAEASAGQSLDTNALYGFPDTGADPVMRAWGQVLSTKRLLTGEGVSYGHTYRAARDTRIALISGGFGQGVMRALGNSAAVQIDGALHRIVGRVAMDVCVIDIGDHRVAPGDIAVHFGGSGPARWGLIGWEAATRLTAAELACAVGLHSVRRETA